MAKELPSANPAHQPAPTKPAKQQNKPSETSLLASEKYLTAIASPSAADLLHRYDDLTNLWNDGSLIKPKDMELTPGALKLMVWAAEDLSQAQHEQGMKYLVRNSQYWPNGAQYRAACLGVPVGSLNAAKAVDDDALEVNRLWGWLVKWWSWLDEGHRFQLTIAAFTDHPVTHEFTNRSLNDGIWPYRASDAALVAARSAPPVARKHLTFLEYEVPTLEALLLEWSEEDRKMSTQENQWRNCLEQTPQHPVCIQQLDIVLEHREYLMDKINRARTKIQEAKERVKAAPTAIENAEAVLKKAEADFQLAQYDRVWCLLRVVMPPLMPPLLREILEQLEGTVGAALQKFVKFMQSNDDPFLRAKFQKAGVQLMAAHEREVSPLPHSRQLAGAVQSGNDPRVFTGVITFDSDNDAAYYFVEALSEARADGIPINDDAIEAQAIFQENVDEIWNAPYPRPLSPDLAVRAYNAT